MDLYFYNTETKEKFGVRYIDINYEDVNINATYQSSNVLYLSIPKYFWQKTEIGQKSLTFHYYGNKSLDFAQKLESWIKPGKDKKTPPIIQFKIAALPLKSILISSLNIEYDLYFTTQKEQKFTKCKVTLGYLQI